MDLDELRSKSHIDGDNAALYEKIAQLSSTWIELEDQHYRKVDLGKLEMVDAFKEWP